MSSSTVTITGNLTRDPELRFTPAGKAVASMGVAVNHRWKGGDDEWQEKTSFFDVSCWAELGENVASSLHKGDRVVVTGRLDMESWETDDGSKRSKTKIVADEVSPSLRWATVAVTRNARNDEGGGYPAASSNGRRAPQAARAGGGNTAPYPDEEPF